MTSPDFRRIYDEHKDLVYNLALQYVHNADDAQDVVQEVFVKVHDRLHTYDPAAASMKTWIYRITINHSLDLLKAQRRKKRFAFLTSLFRDDGEPIEPPDFDHPGVLLEDKEAVEHLFRRIDALPPQQRTALILLKIEDRTQKEAAEIMGISEKALESLLQRAKKALAHRRKS